MERALAIDVHKYVHADTHRRTHIQTHTEMQPAHLCPHSSYATP